MFALKNLSYDCVIKDKAEFNERISAEFIYEILDNEKFFELRDQALLIIKQ